MSMNQRIAIYARTPTQNSHGEQADSYALSGSVWGRVKHSVAAETIQSNKHTPSNNIQIVARNFSGGVGDEIEYAGFRWEVEGVRRQHRNNNTTIIANRLRAVVAAIEYYLQPDGSSFYLTPTAEKYIQP